MQRARYGAVGVLLALAAALAGCSDDDPASTAGTSGDAATGATGTGGSPGAGGGGGAGAAGGAATTGSGGAPGGELSGSVFGTDFELVTGTADETDGTLYVTLASFRHVCDFSETKPETYVFVNVTIPPAAQSVGSHPLGSGADEPRVAATLYGPGTTMQESKIVTEGALEITALDPSGIEGAVDVDVADVTLAGSFAASMCP